MQGNTKGHCQLGPLKTPIGDHHTGPPKGLSRRGQTREPNQVSLPGSHSKRTPPGQPHENLHQGTPSMFSLTYHPHFGTTYRGPPSKVPFQANMRMRHEVRCNILAGHDVDMGWSCNGLAPLFAGQAMCPIV
jgi:hypothetical protein